MGSNDSEATTFSDVIARGFSREKLRTRFEPRAARLRDQATRAAPQPLAPNAGPVTLTTRKDEQSLSDDGSAFKNAVVRLVEEGTYSTLILHHADMSHMMHFFMDEAFYEVGLYRFLAWHRRYLLEAEGELQRVDAILRPGATDKLGIPYWRWQNPFPAWLEGFLPATHPITGAPPPARKNAPPPKKANVSDIDIIVNQFSIQNPPLPSPNDYVRFTYGLEGYGRRPDGSELRAHNHGHGWIGGIMDDLSYSPTDPIFWLHHAEVDRLWEMWRQNNPTSAPPLGGADLIMDPWAESYGDLLDISALARPYAYDDLASL